MNNKYIHKIANSAGYDGYDCIIDLTYEAGNWDGTWLDTFFKCAGFRKNEVSADMRYPVFEFIDDKRFEDRIPSKFVVMACNAGWPQREWSYEKWVELARVFKKEIKIKSVQVGGSNDTYVDGCIDFRGISFNQLGILMSRAKLFVGVDSFPMHIALACLPEKENMIILTCPTSNEHVFMGEAIEIRDHGCRACRKQHGEGLEVLECENPKIKGISVNVVFKAAKTLLLKSDASMYVLQTIQREKV